MPARDGSTRGRGCESKAASSDASWASVPTGATSGIGADPVTDENRGEAGGPAKLAAEENASVRRVSVPSLDIFHQRRGSTWTSADSIRGEPRCRYADPVTSLEEPAPATDPPVADAVRDPLAVADTLRAARQRPMAERLELALSWNAVAAELRAGLAAATRHTNPSQ